MLGQNILTKISSVTQTSAQLENTYPGEAAGMNLLPLCNSAM